MPTAAEALYDILYRPNYDVRRQSFRAPGFRGTLETPAVMRSAAPPVNLPTPSPPPPPEAPAPVRALPTERPTTYDGGGQSGGPGAGTPGDRSGNVIGSDQMMPGGYSIPVSDLWREFVTTPDQSWGQRAAGFGFGAVPGAIPGLGHVVGGALGDLSPTPTAQRDFGAIGARAQEAFANDPSLTAIPGGGFNPNDFQSYGVPGAPAGQTGYGGFSDPTKYSGQDEASRAGAVPTAAPTPEGGGTDVQPGTAQGSYGPEDVYGSFDPSSLGPSDLDAEGRAGTFGESGGESGGSASSGGSADTYDGGGFSDNFGGGGFGGGFFAKGGKVTRKSRMDPPGPDNTYIAAQTGEHVLSRKDVRDVKRGSAANVLSKVRAGKPGGKAPPQRKDGSAMDAMRKMRGGRY